MNPPADSIHSGFLHVDVRGKKRSGYIPLISVKDCNYIAIAFLLQIITGM